MLQDDQGNIWQATLTYRDIKTIRMWPVAEQYIEEGPDGLETKERTVPLSVNLLFINDMVRIESFPMEECEVLAAWLHPQWKDKMTRDEFDGLLTPQFKERAFAALLDQVNGFFTGPGGKMTLQEIDTAKQQHREMMQRAIRKNFGSTSTTDGTNTPESSSLEQTPTT